MTARVQDILRPLESKSLCFSEERLVKCCTAGSQPRPGQDTIIDDAPTCSWLSYSAEAPIDAASSVNVVPTNSVNCASLNSQSSTIA